MRLYHAPITCSQIIRKIPWYFRVTCFSLQSAFLPSTSPITSNNLYTLAGLGITGLVAGLDLVIKGVEVGVDGLRFF